MHYYGTRLSENISRREPEGYLLCLNVPVARTGVQEYLPGELGLTDNSEFRIHHSELSAAAGSGLVSVYRPEEEVFSPETIASFEGMPVTNDHPPEGVDVSNIRALQKGHAHNVRRGSGKEADLLLADLIITDPHLISLILDEGKREISCGYTYELCEENGTYIQRKIRGNHVAVVDAGRAGPRVSIKDHQPERSKNNMKKSLSKILARMARDGDVETVAEFIEEMLEPEAAAPEVIVEEAETVVADEGEEPAAAGGGDPAGPETAGILGDILSRLDQIISLLTPAAADEASAEEVAEAVEEDIEAAETEAAEETPDAAEEVAEIIGEILEPDPGAEPETEGDECEPEPEVISARDALRAALKPLRPVLAKMPKKQRDRVCADIAARLNGKTVRRGIYGALNDASRKRPEPGPDLGRRIMAGRNPNYKQ